MIARILLILAGLFVVGVVGAFLLYISALAVVTTLAIAMGVLAALALGYWAGAYSPDEPEPNAKLRPPVPYKGVKVA